MSGNHSGQGTAVSDPAVEAAAPEQPDDIDAQLAALASGVTNRRRWPLALLAFLVGAAGAGVAAWYVTNDGSGDAAVDTAVADLTTTQLEARDLVTFTEYDASLGFGEPVDIATAATGTVTNVIATGTLVERGAVVAEIDARPVVALYGGQAAWRELSEDVEPGEDVRQLEANLVALGYDPDQTVTIDDEFTANTAAMVERWQEALGIAEPDGVVAPSDVVYVPGPGTVTAAAAVGEAARPGSGVLTLTPTATIASAISHGIGIVADLPPLGSVVAEGEPLFTIEGLDVLAFEPRDPVGDALAGGLDGEGFQEALVAAGYLDEVTDNEFVLAAAVLDWQAAVGYAATGITNPARYVAVPDGTVVVAHHVAEGDELASSRVVFDAELPTQQVTMPLAVAEADRFEVGQLVEIELADESVVSGHVVEISTEAMTEPDAPDAPFIEVVIGVDGELVTELTEGPATVRIVDQEIVGAVVVPTRALIVPAEGGQALEILNQDGTTTLAAVDVGLFQDGYVEILTDGFTPGTEVVVPR